MPPSHQQPEISPWGTYVPWYSRGQTNVNHCNSHPFVCAKASFGGKEEREAFTFLSYSIVYSHTKHIFKALLLLNCSFCPSTSVFPWLSHLNVWFSKWKNKLSFIQRLERELFRWINPEEFMTYSSSCHWKQVYLTYLTCGEPFRNISGSFFLLSLFTLVEQTSSK